MMNRRKRIPYLAENIASLYTTIVHSLKKEHGFTNTCVEGIENLFGEEYRKR